MPTPEDMKMYSSHLVQTLVHHSSQVMSGECTRRRGVQGSTPDRMAGSVEQQTSL